MHGKFIKAYTKYKCPNCHEDTISYYQKLCLSDYRYIHECKECGGIIKLPAWFTFLLLFELFVIFYLNYRLNLINIRALLYTLFLLVLIWFVQFPFIPIRKG